MPTEMMDAKGPVLWARLHRWALRGEFEDADRWLGQFSRSIPCHQCRRHWNEMVLRRPPILSTVDAAFTWTVGLHNAVNENLGKAKIDVARAFIIWQAQAPQLRRPDTLEQVQGTKPQGFYHKTTSCCGKTKGHANRLLLSSALSPGDIVMLTATVRDLHKAYPGRFLTAVQTSAAEIWNENPLVTSNLEDSSWNKIEMHYPLVNESNQRPVHFIQGYTRYLESKLNIRIPVTAFKGDIYLSEDEKRWTNQVEEMFGYRGKFWIMMAGGKYDFTAKWWPPAYYQQVIDHFAGRIQFVRCGEKQHWHPPLRGVFDLIGKTSIRQFMRLMYHAEGVVCPVTFAMHLAAAVPTKTSRLRPCVVIAGGREPPHWEAYPGHQFLHTVGALSCCATGGCWKSRCQQVGDGDVKDTENLCERPIQVDSGLRIPQCMLMIQPQDVIRAIERALSY